VKTWLVFLSWDKGIILPVRSLCAGVQLPFK
jgi:hypothetical protein